MFGSNNKKPDEKQPASLVSEKEAPKLNIFQNNSLPPAQGQNLFAQNNLSVQGSTPEQKVENPFKIGGGNNLLFGNNMKTNNENPPSNAGSKLTIFNNPGLVDFSKGETGTPNIFSQEPSKNTQSAEKQK